MVFRDQYRINTVIVMEGLNPKYMAEKDLVLEKSKTVWDKVSSGSSKNDLNFEILKSYGLRFYHQEIVNYKSSLLKHTDRSTQHRRARLSSLSRHTFRLLRSHTSMRKSVCTCVAGRQSF
jgi:hypothetical protein